MSKECETWWINADRHIFCPDHGEWDYTSADYTSAEYAWDGCKQKVLDIIQDTPLVGINRSGKTALWEIVKKIKEL